MSGWYVLDAENRCVEVDADAWWKWFSNATNRVVDYTEITSKIKVSTVFLGVDHRFFGKGPPVLFETMAFGYLHSNGYTNRYSSWDDAVAGHAAMVKRLRAALIVSPDI